MKFKVLSLCVATLFFSGCHSTLPKPSVVVGEVRQALETLPEPTYNTLRVSVHDYAALGTKLLISRNPNTKIPLKVLSDSALSVLEKEQASMTDVIELSKSLDDIKEGNVKAYLQFAWYILEINGVIRRDDLMAVLTVREQGLLIALFKGISLGAGSPDEVNKVLNAEGRRY